MPTLPPPSHSSDDQADVILINSGPDQLHVCGVSQAGRDAIAFLLEHGCADSNRDSYTVDRWEERRQQKSWECLINGRDAMQRCRTELQMRKLRCTQMGLKKND